MDNREYIIGIDIGSSSVVIAAGVRDDQSGEISILGVEVQEVEDCVKDGDITNYIELGNAIGKAKTALEGEIGRKINSAYIGLSGRSVYCVRYEDYVEISDKTGCVTDNELRELNARIEMVVPGGGDDIIERIPLRYTIDEHQHVKNPLGAFGRKLSATYLFVLVGKHQIDRVNRALHRAEIKACGLCVNPTLLPDLLLNNDEKEEGVAIVDIGSDLTDISVIREGKLWYFSSLPIGASSINNDLHEFLKISRKDIEQLKKRYGSALAAGVPDNTTVPVKTAGHAKKQILQRNIAEIAEERIKDIAGFVMRELKAVKFSTKLPCGVVLTGGSAYLSGIEELFARELDMEVRLGRMLNGLDDESQQRVSAFPQSAVMGLLLYGAKHNACETMPEFVRSNEPVIREPEKREPEKKDIFTAAPQSEKEEVQPANNTPVLPKEELPSEIEPEKEYNQEEEIVAPPKDDSIKTEKPTEQSPKREPKSGWLDRFRHWVDDMFTDEYI